MSDFFASFKDLNMLSFFQVVIAILALCCAECALGPAPFAIAMAMMWPLAWVAMVCAICFLYRNHAAVQGSANNPIVIPHYHPANANANNPIVIDGNPVPPAGAHEWCADRHDDTANSKVHAPSQWRCVYDTASNQYGMVIGSRGYDTRLIVIWTTGHVEWRTNKGLEKYLEYYQSEVDTGHGIVPQKLNDMINAWIQEYNMIRSGMATEADYSAGSVPFLYDYKNRA
jgi:hypothetical protein